MNKTVLITGGARGIGKATSTLFAENGYNVVVNYNNSEEDAVKLKNELSLKGYNVEIFKADISNGDEVNSLIDFTIKTFNKIDVLVNNAGIAQQKLFTEITDEDWQKMISVNLSSQFNCCRAAAKHMISKKRGSIVNVSSMWGITGASCEVHYSASKSGIIGLTKALAKELSLSNIRVNCVAPGVINTQMIKNLSSDDLSLLVNETPLNRIGEPIDVANAIYFLASDKASFITGQTLSVDGGFII